MLNVQRRTTKQLLQNRMGWFTSQTFNASMFFRVRGKQNWLRRRLLRWTTTALLLFNQALMFSCRSHHLLLSMHQQILLLLSPCCPLLLLLLQFLIMLLLRPRPRHDPRRLTDGLSFFSLLDNQPTRVLLPTTTTTGLTSCPREDLFLFMIVDQPEESRHVETSTM